jgi:hypothetical protein
MVSEPDKSLPPMNLPPGRIWAEQLAMGMALFVGVLVAMAFYYPKMLQGAVQVLTAGDLAAYGWASVIGVVLHFIVHEAGTLGVARYYRLPLRFRLFPFGVNAAAILSAEPRRVWIDAVVGIAGPVTGALVSLILAAIYQFTENPFFLGMACVGYFYNLFTLIPILDLEGGWIAPAVAPQAWFLGIIGSLLELTAGFNLVLLGVVCFAVPRLFLLIRARAPREDLACTGRQRAIIAVTYFVLVLLLAWLGTTTFAMLPSLVREAMSD